MIQKILWTVILQEALYESIHAIQYMHTILNIHTHGCLPDLGLNCIHVELRQQVKMRQRQWWLTMVVYTPAAHHNFITSSPKFQILRANTLQSSNNINRQTPFITSNTLWHISPHSIHAWRDATSLQLSSALYERLIIGILFIHSFIHSFVHSFNQSINFV